MEKITVLVAGCGSIGLRHLRSFSVEGGYRLLAFDVNEKSFRAVREIDGSVRCSTDLDELLDEKPLFVVAATPNEFHETVALAAFARGAHVLSEKPLAHTLESGRRMVAAARSARKVLAVGYSERYRGSFEFVERTAKSGQLGKLVGGRAMVGTYNTLLCAKNDFRSRTFGALLVDYTHEFDMLHAVFGDYDNLVCKANSLADKKLKSDPSLAAMLVEYRTGAIVSVHFDYVQHPQRRLMEIYGDRGVIEFDLQTDTVKIFDCEKSDPEIHVFDNDRDRRFLDEHHDMLRAIRDGVPPRVGGEQALDSLAMAEDAVNQLRG